MKRRESIPGLRSPGSFVGVTNGQIMAVADDLDELVQRMGQFGADLDQTLCLEVGLDYGQVQEFWVLHGCPEFCGRSSSADRSLK